MLTKNDYLKKQIVFVLFNEGEKMAIKNDNLIIKDGEGKTKLQVTCYRLFVVFAVGNFSITSVVLQKARKFGFYIVCMTSGFRLYSVVGAGKDGNTLLKRRQYLYAGIDIGRRIVENKIVNQRNNLSKARNKSSAVLEAIQRLDGYLTELSMARNLNEIMAYEGLAAKVYFKTHFDNVPWNGRQPRMKRDFVNASLDIGYTVLFSFVESLLSCYGFDLYCGVLHREFYMRKSLVCDLVEPFRPVIDHELKKAINLKQIQEKDFTVVNHQYQLKYEHSSRYAKLFLTPLIELKEDLFQYIYSYYCAFMKGMEAGKYPFFYGR